jgi:transcriptional regulator with XRE-family HTH domain
MLSPIESTLSWMSYADRFKEGLARPGKTRKGASDAMGISVQAVGQIANGQTKAATAENNAAAAIYFGCDPSWLATGKGSPGWSNESGDVPSWTAPATVAATLDRLGELLARAEPSTREAVAQLLLRYAQDPDQGKRIAQAIELLLTEGGGGTPPAHEAPRELRGQRIEEGVPPPRPLPKKAAS